MNRRNTVYLLIILCLIGGVLDSEHDFLFHMAYVLSAVLVLSFIFAWTAVNWLRIGRQTYVLRTQVGQQFDETFHIRNTSLIPKLWIEVRDHSTLPQHKSSRVVPLLRGRGDYKWRVQTPCIRRGQFSLGPITLTSGDPFGFFQFPRHISATSDIIVYPATIPLFNFASPIGALSGGNAIRRRTFEVTPNAAGIREYSPGDSLNRIHWKSTARRGKLLVKEFELDPMGDVWIFLDLSRDSLVEQRSVYGGADYVLGNPMRLPPSTEEYGVVVAGSLVQYFIEQNRAVGFLSYTPYREYIAPDRGDRQLTDILEILALARSENDISLHQILALEAPQLSRGTTLIVVTSSLQTTWTSEAYVQSRRGLSVRAVMIDPTSFGKQDGNFEHARQQVDTAEIPIYPVRYNDDLSIVLSDDVGTPFRRY
jgi:uncharacterized protein (DUF58 family)